MITSQFKALMTSKKRNLLFITLGDRSGANTAMIKVAEALSKIGHRVQVLVRDKSDYNPLVTALPPRQDFQGELGHVIDENGKKTYLSRDLKYLFNTINEDISYQETEFILRYLKFNPDLIFVGISFDFLTSTDILELSKITKAVVYNVGVDMSPLTGGCHFAWDCDGYQKGCDQVECPAILDPKYKHLAGRNFKIKKANAEKGGFNLLAGNEWTLAQGKESLIYKNQGRIVNLSGIVDTEIYNPRKRQIAKRAFEFDESKFYILGGSENFLDERKGYIKFIESLDLLCNILLPEDRERVCVLTLSRSFDEKLFNSIKFEKQHIPYITDERLLSLLYQAADVFVNCSLEDSGPSMLYDAVACGTPIVSFDKGAARELIIEKGIGVIVEDLDSNALCAGIKKVFEERLDSNSRDKFPGFDLIRQFGSMEQAVEKIDQLIGSHQKDYGKIHKPASVALCTFNGEKYLSEQLNSILNQNMPPEEILVCDDDSTDNTWKILTSYKQKYPSIFTIEKNEKRLGTVKNFEKAINLCSNEIIFLCDQDDIWIPQKTEVILRIFTNVPEIEAVSHNLQICEENSQIVNLTMWETMGFQFFLEQGYEEKNHFFHSILFGNMVTGAALCIKKPKSPVTFFDSLPDVIHDYQLAVNYLSKGVLYFHNECLGLYRQHESQQIGAKLTALDINNPINLIKKYYETKDPVWNLAYINNRRTNAGIFRYLREIKEPTLRSLVKNSIRINLRNLVLTKNVGKEIKNGLSIVYRKLRHVGSKYVAFVEKK